MLFKNKKLELKVVDDVPEPKEGYETASGYRLDEISQVMSGLQWTGEKIVRTAAEGFIAYKLVDTACKIVEHILVTKVK